MNKLPAELLLKIANYCDFADVCNLAKLDSRWNEVIESNWRSLEKNEIKLVAIEDRQDLKSLLCVSPTKCLDLQLRNGSERVIASDILHNHWEKLELDTRFCEPLYCANEYKHDNNLNPANIEKFVGDIFSLIFKRSSIERLELNSPSRISMQTVAGILVQYCTPVSSLNVRFDDGTYQNPIHHDRMELSDCARIIGLSKSNMLSISLSRQFSNEDVKELLLENIANVHIENVNIEWTNLINYRFGENGDGNDEEADGNQSTPLKGPLPKCGNLVCKGDPYGKFSPIEVSAFVDFIEEWSRNERFIVDYELRYFSEKIKHVAKKFKCELSSRKLDIQLKVVKENKEFVIEKLAARGEDQDRIRLMFQRDIYGHLLNSDESDDDTEDDNESNVFSESNTIFIRSEEAHNPIYQ